MDGEGRDDGVAKHDVILQSSPSPKNGNQVKRHSIHPSGIIIVSNGTQKRWEWKRRNVPWRPIASDLNGLLLINYAWFDIQVNECWCFLLRCFWTLPLCPPLWGVDRGKKQKPGRNYRIGRHSRWGGWRRRKEVWKSIVSRGVGCGREVHKCTCLHVCPGLGQEHPHVGHAPFPFHIWSPVQHQRTLCSISLIKLHLTQTLLHPFTWIDAYYVVWPSLTRDPRAGPSLRE